MKPILLSGAQPTGRLHIGNYLGALKHWVDLQNSGEHTCYFPIVDLHSLTADFDPKEKPKQILELAADYIAAGLDPKRSVIFLQSDVPAHAELAWILSTIAPLGELERMTQFKDKAGLTLDLDRLLPTLVDLAKELNQDLVKLNRNELLEKAARDLLPAKELEARLRETLGRQANANVGLFTYPILMAADILLYDSKFVPVGDDQDQHLELARSLARKFNAKFPVPRSLGVGGGKTFFEPRGLHTKTPRIMSLKDPTKKMSKSHPETCLFLDDTPNEIEKKLKTAVTDSDAHVRYDEKRKPGISNLLDIYAGLSSTSIEKLEKQFAGKNYGEFKAKLIGVIIDRLAPFRKKKAELLKKPAMLKKTLRHGGVRARNVANKKMATVKKALGLVI